MEDVDRFMHFYCTFFTKIGMGSTLWAPHTCWVQHTKNIYTPPECSGTTHQQYEGVDYFQR